MTVLDTHTIVKELISVGISEKEAEVLIKRFVARDEINYFKSEIATKTHIYELRSELKSDISELRSEFFKLENKMDINMKWIMAIGVVIIGLLLKNMFA